jgi:superfamily II DNA or RNA helicase
MIKLRPYQNDAVDLLSKSFKQNKRIVLCLPTGAGKTVVFSEIVKRAALKCTKTIVLTDRTELFKQTIKSISNLGIAIEEISPNKKHTYLDAVIYVGMVETLKRRTELIENLNPSLLIVDEAHKGNFTKILDIFPDARVIGATATPVGKHFLEYYSDIIQNIDVPELVEQGFLVDCKPYQMQDDFSDLQVKAGEFTSESLDMHFNQTKLYDGVIENWQKYALNKKTICFNVSIKHTIAMYEAFINAGISAEYITSKTPKLERERILKAFTNGAFMVLNNCGILTTGYDEPSIECVIMNRATKSLPLWLQCVGRGSRLYQNKKEFVLLDFGGNHTRLGMWNEPRTWSLKEKKKRKSNEVTPVKSCPNCEGIVFASARICRYCEYKFPIDEKELAQGIMVEVIPTHLKGKRISELDLNELIELQQTKKYKASYIWRVVRNKDMIEEYAEIMQYSSGWVWRQQQEQKNDNNNFSDYKI